MSHRIRYYRGTCGPLYVASDAFGVVACSWWTHRALGDGMHREDIVPVCLLVLLFLLLARVTSLYERWRARDANRDILVTQLTWLATVAVALAVVRIAGIASGWPNDVDVAMMALTPFFMALNRMGIRMVRKLANEHGIASRRVAIAGFNQLGSIVAHGLDAGAETQELKLVGVYDDRSQDRRPGGEVIGLTRTGNFADLIATARQGEIDMVMVTLPMRAEERIRWLLEQLSDTTASVYIVPDIFVFDLLHSKWRIVAGLPTVSVYETPFYGVDGIVKRLLDVFLAALLLVLLAIPMLVIGLLVRLNSHGPAIFLQRRYGLDGHEIRVRKFRTMTVCEDGPAVRQAGSNDSRVTTLGRFLRRTSLDELPQLLNVLEGSMSLVGPRPHATAHNEKYRKLINGYMLRHKVKPGITGLAQVEGCRGETETVEKMRRRIEFDHRYIREWSLTLDMQILLKTLWVAWRQPQAY